MRQVSVNVHMVGRTYSKRKTTQDTRNTALLESVKDTVYKQFGSRPVFIANEKELNSDTFQFPEFYAAGWFVSTEGVEGPGVSELVVIAAGSSMASANSALFNHIANVDWVNTAYDVL